MKPCPCGGRDLNCSKCHGSGVIGGKPLSKQNMPQPKHGAGGGGKPFRKDKFRKGKFHGRGGHTGGPGGGGGGGRKVECPMCGQTVPNLAQHIREKHDYTDGT